MQETQEMQFRSLGWEDPLEEEMAPTPPLPRKSHGQRNLVGYSPWGHKRVKHDLDKQQQKIPLVLPKEHDDELMTNKCLNNNCVTVVGKVMSSLPPHSQKMSAS